MPKNSNACAHFFDLHRDGIGTLQAILSNLSGVIGNCYVDPLADAEAERRGFNVRKLDALTIDYMSIYCLEIRAGKPLHELENFFAEEPEILERFMVLKELEVQHDEWACYAISKQLRDEFDWAKYVLMTNPTTGRVE